MSIVFEEAKVLDFVGWLNYYYSFLFFSVWFHFSDYIGSLTKDFLKIKKVSGGPLWRGLTGSCSVPPARGEPPVQAVHHFLEAAKPFPVSSPLHFPLPGTLFSLPSPS